MPADCLDASNPLSKDYLKEPFTLPRDFISERNMPRIATSGCELFRSTIGAHPRHAHGAQRVVEEGETRRHAALHALLLLRAAKAGVEAALERTPAGVLGREVTAQQRGLHLLWLGMVLGFLGDLIGVLEALLTCHGLKSGSSTVSQGQQSMNITLDLTQEGHTVATVLLAKHTSREVSKGWKKQQS